WVISHSWVEDSDRFLARTAINGYDWPVPLPKGVTLESVRDELIGHGAEYFWLDVLCLRQEDRSGMRQLEELREVEWALDVPTIGNIYSNYASEVVRYYNGLGRPLKTNGWDSDFHWTNRALTLQESLQSITGGVSAQESELLSSASIEDGRYMRYTIAQFELSESTVRISQLLKKPASMLREMKYRKSTQEVDKVAGIGFLIWAPTLPTFSKSLNVEEAWTRCVRHMRTGQE
ncbi:hypothetical protein FPQ18DRAFT_260727, partial [Pyronema domesticum]